ncbi:MAG: hypothetical protein ACON5P_08845 [Candidatus Puniceispirillaceae bacterium]
MRKEKHYVMGSAALIGAVGWAMLVLPELHFIYKQLIPALGEGKYIAFLLMGAAMFFSLPVVLVRKIFTFLLPAYRRSWLEKAGMGLACAASIFLSRSFM